MSWRAGHARRAFQAAQGASRRGWRRRGGRRSGVLTARGGKRRGRGRRRSRAGHGAGGSELPVDYLYAACGFFGAVLGREKSRIKNVARDTGTTLWQRGHGGFI